MLKQIKNLTKLQLKNLYGINVYRFTKDKKEKKKKFALMLTYILLIVVAAFYIGSMAFGYIYMGMASILPAYLIMLSSFIILFFEIFKAGSVIFQRNAYEILISLPLSRTAIVVSRFIRMYVENLILTLVVMLPATLVYGIMIKPGISFYFIGLIVTVFIPFIPITIAVFFGALITAIASRMKHKSLVSAALSILLVVAYMLGMSQITALEDEFGVEIFQNLVSTVLTLIEKIYPPAVWLGNAMVTGDFVICIACVATGILVFFVVIAIVALNYEWICRGLYSTNAKHDYQMGNLKKNTVLGALYKRELKRYFSSSVYVTNTIIGPILAVVFSASVSVMGLEQMQAFMEIPIDIRGVVPFALAGMFCIMPTTCSSISLEGKEWWIMKSLPVRTKDLLDSKLLLNLSLVLPFFIVSEILFVICLKPDIVELLWLFIIPVIMIVFSSVFGMTVNLKMPVFNWENEVTIVKQSAAAFFGGIGGFLIVLFCMVPTLLAPSKYANVVKMVVCVAVGVVTCFLYQKNNKVNLQEL